MPWVSLKADGPPDPASAGNTYVARKALARIGSREDSMSHCTLRILDICESDTIILLP